MTESIIYKEFYNKERGLPEPVWGGKVPGTRVQCPTCGSTNMHYSGSQDDPEEVLNDVVRCRHCGHLTDIYEAQKQRANYPRYIPLKVIRKV